MKQRNNVWSLASIMVILVVMLGACKKYLDKKTDSTLETLSTPEVLQAFLDDNNTMNLRYPFHTELMSDNHYIPDDFWSSLPKIEQDLYLWKIVDVGTDFSVWPYRQILYANSALEEVEKVNFSKSGENIKNNIRASALFFRGLYLNAVIQMYAKPYEQTTASTDLGIPLRISANHEDKSTRATLQESYNQIIKDLRDAAPLLPNTPLVKTRPSKPAAYGLLSKVFLSMKKYDSAGYYADKCLQIYDSLLDFNSDINPSDRAPIKRFNKETIFYAKSLRATSLIPSLIRIDSNLIKLYQSADIRKQAFFRDNGDNTYTFKGDYDGLGTSGGILFAGIVTDEIYLIRSECFARNEEVSLALQDLNLLLKKRYRSSEFTPVTTADANELIKIILTERRKELLFRGTRWIDLRRLKDEPGFSTVPQRFIANQHYELKPSDPRFTVKFPYEVIAITGMQQNP